MDTLSDAVLLAIIGGGITLGTVVSTFIINVLQAGNARKKILVDADTEQQKNITDASQKLLDAMTLRLHTLDERLDAAEKNATDWQARYFDLTGRVKALETEREFLQSRAKDTAEEKALMQTRITDLERALNEEVSHTKASTDERLTLQKRIDDLTAENKSLLDRITVLETKLTALTVAGTAA